jgi:hypothetical protein
MGGVLKEDARCEVDCATAKKYKSQWEALRSNGFYFPVAGSYWWPWYALDDLCHDKGVVRPLTDETAY